MTRYQLEHIIRASAAIADDDEIVIIGSQSILGMYPDAPAAMRVSMEADVFPRHKTDAWNIIDGAIGEGSPFHDTFGYYAQGVGPETAVLPLGWESRLVAIRNENTRGATGWALEAHDLAISKYVAGREKDRSFLEEAIRHRLLSRETLLTRLATTPIDEGQRRRITAQIETQFNALRAP